MSDEMRAPGSYPKGWRQREVAAQQRRARLNANQSVREQRAKVLADIKARRHSAKPEVVEDLPNPLSKPVEAPVVVAPPGEVDSEGALHEDE
jgi:hypothetical protein